MSHCDYNVVYETVIVILSIFRSLIQLDGIYIIICHVRCRTDAVFILGLIVNIYNCTSVEVILRTAFCQLNIIVLHFVCSLL